VDVSNNMGGLMSTLRSTKRNTTKAGALGARRTGAQHMTHHDMNDNQLQAYRAGIIALIGSSEVQHHRCTTERERTYYRMRVNCLLNSLAEVETTQQERTA
jgi:hypothetical protein